MPLHTFVGFDVHETGFTFYVYCALYVYVRTCTSPTCAGNHRPHVHFVSSSTVVKSSLASFTFFVIDNKLASDRFASFLYTFLRIALYTIPFITLHALLIARILFVETISRNDSKEIFIRVSTKFFDSNNCVAKLWSCHLWKTGIVY